PDSRNSRVTSLTSCSSSASKIVPVPRGASPSGSTPPAFSSGSSTRGRQILKHVPFPTSRSTQLNPPLCFTTPYTVERPSPVPFPCSLVVKNGSKICVCVSASIPVPVSETARQM